MNKNQIYKFIDIKFCACILHHFSVKILIDKYKDDYFDVEIKRRHKLDKNSSGCPGGKSIFHINAYGKVSPCSWISKLDYDELSLMWKKGNLEECFNMCRKIDTIVDQRKNKYSYSGCPALASIHTGDILSKDPIEGMI